MTDLITIQKWVELHQHKANTLFSTYASAYTTVMFSKKILLGTFGLTLSGPYAIGIVTVALFNILLDKYVFDLLEMLLEKIQKDVYRILKINIEAKISLEKRELIKFAILLIIAIICVSVGAYIIPIALFLFQSGYFVNYMLQVNTLSDTFSKIFLTRNEAGKWLLFQGFLKNESITLNAHQMHTLKIGAFFSMIYALAMAGLAAKWLLPLIASISLLGSLASPLGIFIIAGLVVYGIIYGLLTLRGWANLIQLDAQLKVQYGFGILSFHAGLLFAHLIWDGIKKYWFGDEGALNKSQWFLIHLIFIFTAENKTDRRYAASYVLKSLFIQLPLALLRLCWKIITVILSIACLYGMYFTLEQGCAKIGQLLGSTETGFTLTLMNCAAYSPFMLQSAAFIALPDKPEKQSTEGIFSKWGVGSYRILNSMRNAFVPNGGDLPSNATQGLLVTSTAAASFVAVHAVKENFIELQRKRVAL